VVVVFLADLKWRKTSVIQTS